ncbi:TadE/TadG family type IV pilus assembly protein [Novosphingobium sp. TH158]|uniref:TadE/TadG family type IV pilus assembly protein n=1 Tax=Novosphingobium sp. TH158 TaxID=2067455 RepID=UPI000C7E7923|nr:TadE/TadG family type IV pilus assembly protein [Novosphingobium sp. TH158]PLK26553.1 hypothetical protein C0V78_06355 [Novosphingobium sp. TH158]
MYPQTSILATRDRLARLMRPLARLKRDRSGQTLTVFALSLTPVIAGVGLAIDAAQWVAWQNALRNAADLSALAGARAKINSQNVERAVRLALAKNEQRSFTIEAVQNPPSTGTGTADNYAVRVVLSVEQALPFSSIFLSTAPRIQVESTAKVFGGTPNCVLGLDPSGTTAVSVTGSASLTMQCGMASNSIGAPALLADAQTVAVPSLSAVGSVTAGSGVPSTTTINAGASAQQDPYAGLPLPNPGSLCNGAPAVTVKSMTSLTINPGCYSSIKSLGSLTLNPGIYYINGGDVQVGSQSLISGDGVTLIFTNIADPTKPGRFDAAGNSYVRLIAPSTGTYAGIIIYQDPRTVTSSKTNMFVTGTSFADYSGTWFSQYQGAIYAPKSSVRFTGNSGVSTPCMQIVSFQVEFTGNTTITNNCPNGSGAGAFGGATSVKLIG